MTEEGKDMIVGPEVEVAVGIDVVESESLAAEKARIEVEAGPEPQDHLLNTNHQVQETNLCLKRDRFLKIDPSLDREVPPNHASGM